ncbi:hypothetical protein ID852_06670 [Xenorhabdus sp. 42]|uniref:Uncharacterized protein n=1 Tax=Xenorhabdus szentirmaii TaxID=290112 RepID=A0AAW3YQV1_9GAMM|nr:MULTISPECIES: hypothetical protein [unclassified Xenorhabdus]MBD2800422.1 hypothetical protein [Xenorhabdus sp. M]MBD2781260.1 hypothetical protein [Xenorhabdus sp. 38]MBD2792744.1 hypothetical protein [Xenorhabdus sp. CUL]MBD2820378.1 hypothetical protein [Xenorhabdus sp. 42]MBD2824335.1 hypothetical protein [Xenorhabdus sp. 5]
MKLEHKDFHFYTLKRAESRYAICHTLGYALPDYLTKAEPKVSLIVRLFPEENKFNSAIFLLLLIAFITAFLNEDGHK